MLLIFQVLFSIFTLVTIINIIKRKKEGIIGPKGLAFWTLFWLVAAAAVWWPNSTTIVANSMGIGRGTDLVVYVAIIALFYLVFKLHLKLESVGRDVVKIITKVALNNKD